MQPQLKPLPVDPRHANAGPYDHATQAPAAAQSRRVLRNTYLLLALTMVPTALGAWAGMSTAGIVAASPVVSTLAMLAGVIGLQFAIARYRTNGIGVALLFAMTGLLGWWLGPILNLVLALQNGTALVGFAAAGTGLIFFAMAAAAQAIKRDLSFLGKFLFVGMLALLAAMLANMFLQIPALALTLSTLVIVVFSLFLVYDLQRIVRGGETNYLMAATGVYLSLFNIFASLLQLLAALAGQRE